MLGINDSNTNTMSVGLLTDTYMFMIDTGRYMELVYWLYTSAQFLFGPLKLPATFYNPMCTCFTH